jgi:hypothetical protein
MHFSENLGGQRLLCEDGVQKICLLNLSCGMGVILGCKCGVVLYVSLCLQIHHPACVVVMLFTSDRFILYEITESNVK